MHLECDLQVTVFVIQVKFERFEKIYERFDRIYWNYLWKVWIVWVLAGLKSLKKSLESLKGLLTQTFQTYIALNHYKAINEETKKDSFVIIEFWIILVQSRGAYVGSYLAMYWHAYTSVVNGGHDARICDWYLRNNL